MATCASEGLLRNVVGDDDGTGTDPALRGTGVVRTGGGDTGNACGLAAPAQVHQPELRLVIPGLRRAGGRGAGAQAHVAGLHLRVVGDLALGQRSGGQAVRSDTGFGAADYGALQVSVSADLDLEAAIAGLDAALFLHAGVIARDLRLIVAALHACADTIRGDINLPLQFLIAGKYMHHIFM